jgi:uncharacterized protein (DUF2164 family)
MKPREKIIPLTKEQKTEAVAKIKNYISENFDIEIGNMQSEFFLDFITENIGCYYYNKAVADSMAFITDKTEDMYLLVKDEKL